jgi:hypothetical protein
VHGTVDLPFFPFLVKKDMGLCFPNGGVKAAVTGDGVRLYYPGIFDPALDVQEYYDQRAKQPVDESALVALRGGFKCPGCCA